VREGFCFGEAYRKQATSTRRKAEEDAGGFTQDECIGEEVREVGSAGNDPEIS
jgi:hypothetical protein